MEERRHPEREALAGDASDCLAQAERFMRRWSATSVPARSRLVPDAPLVAIQSAAVGHPDPWLRRRCLGYLDHYANDASVRVFAAALHDPIDFVRNAALHSIACESCRSEELCVADVVPALVEVLESDPSPELRHKTIAVLRRLSGRDRSAREAVERAATADSDPLIREAAELSLRGGHLRSRKAYERTRRRRSARG